MSKWIALVGLVFFVDVSVNGTCDPATLPGVVSITSAKNLTTYLSGGRTEVTMVYQGTGPFVDAREAYVVIRDSFAGVIPEGCQIRQLQVNFVQATP